MKIRLNNSEQEIQENHIDLISLLKQKNLFVERGIAVAINEEIIPKNTWKECFIKENDNILIITATQGG